VARTSNAAVSRAAGVMAILRVSEAG
jgi:hypothetical protein